MSVYSRAVRPTTKDFFVKYVPVNGVLGIYEANGAGLLNPRNPYRTVKRSDDRRRKTYAWQESFCPLHQFFYSSYYVFCRTRLIVIIHLGVCNTLLDLLKDRGDRLRGFDVREHTDIGVRNTLVGLLKDRGDGLREFDMCQRIDIGSSHLQDRLGLVRRGNRFRYRKPRTGQERVRPRFVNVNLV